MIGDTITARVGFHVKRADDLETGETRYAVLDGKKVVLASAQLRRRRETVECLKNRRRYKIEEVFSTMSGNQFVYWRDTNTDEAFLTLIRKEVRPDG